MVFTPEAEDHLEDLYLYIADAAAPEIAVSYVDKVITYCEGRGELPHRGHARRHDAFDLGRHAPTPDHRLGSCTQPSPRPRLT